ncbi:hypothetical protein [Candidatus Leptofilum sp.]|uniref:hypothetical protein n=1 Tax=Candidatus Leptofilum sp. TaxID=3241576 RepID=UPI003B5C6E16
MKQIIVIAFAASTILSLLLNNNQPVHGQNTKPTVTIYQPAADIEAYLAQQFCSTQLCVEADWQQWLHISPKHPWTIDDLRMINHILTSTIEVLEKEGVDGRSLLSGYKFRRQHGEYIQGHPGRIAVINHTRQEIILADAAFLRLRGFSIYHELGHAVDARMKRQLTAEFHTLIGSDMVNRQTAVGFWMNQRSQNDLEEATADAFALWIITTYEDGYRPVFVGTPLDTHFEGIVKTFETALLNSQE